MKKIAKIKSSLYSPYYAEACNELRGPSPRLSAWAAQLRRNVAAVASRWRHCADLSGPGIEPQTSRTDSVSLATELTAGKASAVMRQLHRSVVLKRELCTKAKLSIFRSVFATCCLFSPHVVCFIFFATL